MPVTPTYPGVYVQEVPSGVRTIVGVSTSATAFIGYFSRGPMDKAVQIYSWADFVREFGGLHRESEASYAIQQFFLNGGSEAWIVRTANGAKQAAINLLDACGTSGAVALEVKASSEGTWGDNVRIDVDHATTEPDDTFNMVIRELDSDDLTTVIRTETFRNLSLDSSDPNYAVDVVNAGSELVTLKAGSSTDRPAQTGTVSSVDIATTLPTVKGTGGKMKEMDVFLGSTSSSSLGKVKLTSQPTTQEGLRADLQSAIRDVDKANKLTEKATVELLGSKSTKMYLRIKAGTTDDDDVLAFKYTGTGTDDLAEALGLDDEKLSNVQQYALGGTTVAAQAIPSGGTTPVVGKDGTAPTATELIGDPTKKTGLYALEDVDIFNILCIPGTMNLASDADSVITAATEYCEERRAFYIVDFPSPPTQTCDDPSEIKDWLDEYATLRHRNAALYFPRIKIPDALNKYRSRTVGVSGTVAGLYARTDGERGVWKAPAGTEATLTNVRAMEYQLTDAENGTLNHLAINCLRSFPVYGNVCWGARTLKGADQLADEYKYIPIRRLALFLEESLYRGLKWVVFEPNDEPLWAQIRLNVGAFMHDLFRKGAFQGQKPKDAYFVKCDSETTTQTDRNLGIVNIWVGFAPLKPAEFVIIYLQQMAGQIQT
jgi:phage tail sheath protein FI